MTPNPIISFSKRWVFGVSTVFVLISTVVVVALHPLGLAYDYPNHLARTHIEAFLSSSAPLRQYYTVSFGLIPDLTMDLTVPWLAPLFGTYSAGAVLIALALLLAPVAGLLISRFLVGNSPPWLALLAFLPLFSAPMAWGFVNFVAASGLALLAFLGWARMRSGLRRSTIMMFVGVFLFFNHALAFLLFGYLALLWELSELALFRKESSLRRTARLFRKLLLIDSWAFLPGLALLVYTVIGTTDLRPTASLFEWAFPHAALIAPFAFFNNEIAGAMALCFYGLFALGLFTGWIAIPRRMVVICLGMLLLVLVMPESAFGIWGLHFRFGSFFAVLLAASCRLGSPSKVFPLLSVAMFAGLFAISQANAHYQMGQVDTEMTRLRTAFADMETGAKLLTARHPAAQTPYLYLGEALAVIEVDAYVTSLFTNTSPVGVKEAMKPLHLPDAKPVILDKLTAAMRRSLPESPNGHWSPSYYYGWPQNFDYLLCFKPSTLDTCIDLPILQRIASAPEFDLYRISRDVDVQ